MTDTITIVVRYFAAHREITGRSDETLTLAPGTTVGALWTLLTERYPRWQVFTHTGRDPRPTGLDAIEWARRGVELGAGEIVINSMDEDGVGGGYDIDLLRAITEAVNVPVIASGGVGSPEHMYAGLVEGRADAVLAASIFHFGAYTIRDVKQYLAERGVPVRL